MKLSGLFLIGVGLAGAAHAQTNSGQIQMLPIPDELPRALFAPDPLAGSMLMPLRDPEPAETATIPPQDDAEATPQATLPAEAVTLEAPADAGAEVAEPQPTQPETPLAAVPDAAETPPTTPQLLPEAAPSQAAVPAAPSEPDLSTSVHVIVENVTSTDGIVNVAVCDSGLSEEGCPYKTSAPAAAGFVEMKLDGIPPGTYAVVGYHDVNGNDEFDKFLGMPREPYALSSTAAESLVPSFSDAALDIREGENVVIIRLKTFGGG